MKIFILEDDPNRIKRFHEKLGRHKVTFCDNVEAAKAILEAEKFDVIFFDHDLGGEIMVESSHHNTGYQLAKWIREKGLTFSQIVIHSCNNIGASNIYNEVKGCSEDVILMPFPFLIQAMED